MSSKRDYRSFSRDSSLTKRLYESDGCRLLLIAAGLLTIFPAIIGGSGRIENQHQKAAVSNTRSPTSIEPSSFRSTIPRRSILASKVEAELGQFSTMSEAESARRQLVNSYGWLFSQRPLYVATLTTRSNSLIYALRTTPSSSDHQGLEQFCYKLNLMNIRCSKQPAAF